jgi:hypothetical protein
MARCHGIVSVQIPHKSLADLITQRHNLIFRLKKNQFNLKLNELNLNYVALSNPLRIQIFYFLSNFAEIKTTHLIPGIQWESHEPDVAFAIVESVKYRYGVIVHDLDAIVC